ncbi:hypothetical protein ACA545_02135, partial [Vibrio cholerae]|uniref:hypothetical protein n=1 Tax=Vibrio cholerae TaxID=666 RepID=UPI003A0FDB18
KISCRYPSSPSHKKKRRRGVELGNVQLGFSTSTTADKLVGGSSIKSHITVTDAAGNSTTKSDSEDYSVDTVAPEQGCEREPLGVAADNAVTKAEAEDIFGDHRAEDATTFVGWA